MHFLISGVTGTRNHGVEALVCSIIEQLKVQFPECELTLATSDVSYDSYRLAKYCINCVDECRELLGANLNPMRKLLEDKFGKDRHKLRPLLAAIQACDAIIVTGGDIFASEYGIDSLKFHFRIPELGLKYGKPSIYLAHSIGPFVKSEQLEIWNENAKHATLISLRESASFEYVKKHLPQNESMIHKTADVAFLLQPDPASERLISALHLDHNRPFVTCSTSQGISKFSNLSQDQHLIKWIDTIKHLVTELKTQVVLIPHVQEKAPTHNDIILATDIMRNLPDDIARDVRIMGGEYSASEYKTVISKSAMLIAERMHAAIAGLSTSVPTIVIGYSIKAVGILTDLLGEWWVANGVLVSVEDFLNKDTIKLCIKNVWDERAQLSKDLSTNLPQMKSDASKNFELLAKAISS